MRNKQNAYQNSQKQRNTKCKLINSIYFWALHLAPLAIINLRRLIRSSEEPAFLKEKSKTDYKYLQCSKSKTNTLAVKKWNSDLYLALREGTDRINELTILVSKQEKRRVWNDSRRRRIWMRIEKGWGTCDSSVAPATTASKAQLTDDHCLHGLEEAKRNHDTLTRSCPNLKTTLCG
jgi:hypothetical protein